MTDDLMMPAFLKRERGVKPPKFKTPRWSRIAKAEKPEGERYEDAERWELFVESSKTFLPKLACGWRKFWVADAEDGSRKVWLHDGEHEASLPMKEWQRLSAKARRVE